jgi:hypothetical protein
LFESLHKDFNYEIPDFGSFKFNVNYFWKLNSGWPNKIHGLTIPTDMNYHTQDFGHLIGRGCLKKYDFAFWCGSD